MHTIKLGMSHRILPYLALLCCGQLYAQTLKNIADNTSVNLGASSSNLIVGQTYINNYYKDNGINKLKRFSQNLQIPLSENGQYNTLFDIHNIYMPDINTNVTGFNLVYRTPYPNGAHIGFFTGYDYTHYDKLAFSQAVLGAEARIYELDSTLTMMLPVGPGQNYSSIDPTFEEDGANLTGLYGVEIHGIKKLASFDYIFQTSTHWHYNTKNQLTSVGLGLNYHWENITLGTTGQYRNGLNNDTYGASVYAEIALQNKAKRTLPKRLARIERQYGATIDAEEFNCAAGFTAYSANGINSCNDTNPNDNLNTSSGVYISKPTRQLADGIKLKAGSDFSSSSILLNSDQPLVFEKGIHILNNLYYVCQDVTVKPGAVLLFGNESGLIIDPSRTINIGDKSNPKQVILSAGPFFRHHMLKAASGSRTHAGYRQILRGFTADKRISAETSSDLFPVAGILITGNSRADFNANAFNTNNFSTASKLNSTATGSNNVEGLDSVISMYPFTNDDTVAGGMTDLQSRNYIIKTRSHGVPIRGIAANLVFDEFQSMSANQEAISVTGGGLSIRNSHFIATMHTPTLVETKAGAQTRMRDTIFDLSLSKPDTPAIKLSHFGNSTQIQNVTGLSVEYSYFKGAKGNDSQTGTDIFIKTPSTAPTNTSSNGNGFTLSLLNNTFDGRRFPTNQQVASGSNSTSLLELTSDSVFNNANSDPASTIAQSIGLYGNTMLYNNTYLDDSNNSAKDTLMQMLAGLGYTITPATGGNDYPNNNTNMINPGNNEDVGSTRIETQPTLLAGINESGAWFGTADTANYNNATFPLLRALDTTYQSRQSTGLLAKNDVLELIATNTADGSSRSPLVATLAYSPGNQSETWEPRAGTTTENSAYGYSSNALIRQMRQAEQMHDIQFQNYLQARIANNTKSWDTYTNSVTSDTQGTVINLEKA